MKELSIEEKAKAYDEALKKIHKFIDGYSRREISKEELEDIFPELKEESESEKIRKALISQYKGDGCICTNKYRIDFKDIRAWLEKQGKKESVTCPICGWEIEKQGEQKPAEWSEKDKKLIDDTCHLINTLASGYGEKVTEPITLSGTQMITSIKDRLRALVDNRPQSTWKPSDEQMEALEHFIVYHNGSTNYAKDLEELRLQLKKLRDE